MPTKPTKSRFELIRQYGGDAPGVEVIKVKTMTSDEVQMNVALEAAGITPIETDLADMIVQMGHDEPSHIVVPALHKNRSRDRRNLSQDHGSSNLDRSARRPNQRRENLPARPLSACQDRRERSQLRCRRNRHRLRSRVRRQRTHVPYDARCAHLAHRYRESHSHVSRPRSLPSTASPIRHRRAHEPVQLSVDRRHTRRRPERLPRHPSR